MFFYLNKLRNKPKTFLKIKVSEDRTIIEMYENNGTLKSDTILIKQGYKDALSYADALKFIDFIELKILCCMNLPSKIDDIYIKCNGHNLLEKELKKRFCFCKR